MNKPNVSLLGKVMRLAFPFGRFRLAIVFTLVLFQGLFQIAGVTSIFPFLALAADPQRIHDSEYGKWFLSFLPEMSTSELLLLAGGFAVTMMVASNIVNILSEFIRNRYAHDFGHWMRVRLLSEILSQPYSYFLENNSAVLLKKVYTDVMGYVTGVLLPLLEAFARLVTCVMLVITLLFVQFEITLLATAVIGTFYLLIYYLLKKKREQISGDFKDSWRRCSVELQQLFGGIKPVKVHEVERNFVRRFERPSRKIADHGAWLPVFMHVPRYVIEPVAFGGMIAMIVYFHFKGNDMAGILPNMGIMALAGYRLLPSLQLLYAQLTQVSAARHTLEEVYDEFEKSKDYSVGSNFQDEVHSQPLNWADNLCFEGITFQYNESDTPVFNDLTLEIIKNTSVAFVGKTGSGKSTIVDLITGLHQPQSGRLTVDGFPITPENLSGFRAAIGYVPQDVFLTDDTIAGNIALGISEKEIDHDRLIESAKIAQIQHFIESELPLGFQTVVGERGVRLSGGQRQRIGLARAVYRNPSILIFDEATSALDNETESELMSAINTLSHDKTIIMIAHRLTTVQNCDQIFMLSDGKVKVASFDQLPT